MAKNKMEPPGLHFKERLAPCFIFGGDEEDRTLDLRIANATLSQLSYIPDDKNILAHPVNLDNAVHIASKIAATGNHIAALTLRD